MFDVEVVDIVEDGLDLVGRGGRFVFVADGTRNGLRHFNFRHDGW
jgi:hypothetical protein